MSIADSFSYDMSEYVDFGDLPHLLSRMLGERVKGYLSVKHYKSAVSQNLVRYLVEPARLEREKTKF